MTPKESHKNTYVRETDVLTERKGVVYRKSKPSSQNIYDVFYFKLNRDNGRKTDNECTPSLRLNRD